jgi:hypothetical protein
MPVINGVYTKDFPALGRAPIDADIIPIAEVANQITYKTTIGEIFNAKVFGTTGRLSKFTGANTLANSILNEIGNAIHLTNSGSSFASFGIINPGTPGDPGVDNDCFIGSTINNDFTIRVNNTEAARFDTALRFKIANIPNADTDTDKFLVSDNGTVKYRTGAQVLSDIGGASASGYVTLDTAQTITAAKTFSTSGGSDTLIINHSSGSGIALNITKGGNGEGIYVNKTSGTGNAVTIIGTLNATTLVKSGGTSSQFLKADGSVDSTSYGTGSVTSVAAITLGTSGFDLSSTVANETTTPVITLNVPTASSIARGVLSSADWTTFNNKQPAGSYVTTNTVQSITGNKTFSGSTLRVDVVGTSAISSFTNNSTSWSYSPSLNSVGFNNSNNFYIANVNGNGGIFTFSNPATVVSYAFPATSGTIALTSNLSAYLPLSGGTLTGALGGTSATFSSSVTANSLVATNGNNGVLTLGSATYFTTIQHDSVVTGATIYTTAAASGGGHIFKIGTTTPLTITSAGNVLIGTTTDAGYKLDVNGTGRFSGAVTAGVITSSVASGTGTLKINNSSVSKAWSFYPTTNGSQTDITLYEEGTGLNIMTFKSGGNVGIGTTSPDGTLVLAAGTNGTASTGGYLGFTTGANNSKVRGAGIETFTTDSSNNHGLRFYTNAAASSPAVRMTLTDTGNVGIGTTSPNNFDSAANQLVVGNGSTNQGITINTSTSSEGSIYFADGTGTSAYRGYIYYNHAYDFMAFGTSTLRAMTITSGGNVGIGTTSPGAKLEVVSSGGSQLLIGFAGNSQNYYDANTHYFRGTFGGAGGNVLIGTTTDNGAKLQVNGGVFINGVTSNVLISHGEKFIPLSGPNSVHSFDVATEFPSLAISGNVLGVTMFLTIFGSGGSVYSAIATIARNSGGTWSAYGLTAITSTASLLSSITGSGTTITINTSAGSYVGVKVTAITQ